MSSRDIDEEGKRKFQKDTLNITIYKSALRKEEIGCIVDQVAWLEFGIMKLLKRKGRTMGVVKLSSV